MPDRFLNVQITVIDETHLDDIAARWDEYVPPALTMITEQIAGEAQARAPVGVSGTLRAGITPEVDNEGVMVTHGYVYFAAGQDYAPIIEGVDPETGEETEYGRRPGAAWPNVDALKLWVERVLGISDERELDEVTFLVGRAIVQRGIPRDGYEHFRPIGTALEMNRQFANDEIDRALALVFQ
jgi:hypothetical protein